MNIARTIKPIIDNNRLKLPNRPTHLMCNRQAGVILANDGLEAQSNLIHAYQSQLDAGVEWPDRGIQSIHHFYNFKTGCGLPGCRPANHYFIYYLNYARRLFAKGNYPASMFYLGAATHYLQDLCEPHHSNCRMLRGHGQYEHWVEEHLKDFSVDSAGIYRGWGPSQWLEQCANFSNDWLPAVSGDDNLFTEASHNLLAFTQRVTAGFWDFFIRWVNWEETAESLLKAVL